MGTLKKMAYLTMQKYILRNNSSIFAIFIDLKKAFDFIDREMLLCKLLLYNIDGKLYNSIKSIYASTSACVRVNQKTGSVEHGGEAGGKLFSDFVLNFYR